MNSKEIFYSAECFDQISTELIQRHFMKENDYSFIPTIVNLVFACELYLKSLINLNGSFPQTHHLKDLFNALPNEILLEITTSLNEIRGEGEWQTDLKDIDNAFVDWRYYFQHKSLTVNLIFLEDFTVILHDTCEKYILNNSSSC